MRDKQNDSLTFSDGAVIGNTMTCHDPGLIDFGEDYLLHVECGPNQAKLYLNRLKMGSRGACVVFNNAWLTPNQFQAVSGRKTAKDWKRSIKHFGKSLKLLLAKGTLTIDPADCRCENCSGNVGEAPELAASLSVGSDEENVPPIKDVHRTDTPLSPRITSSPPGDISVGPQNGGTAGEILGTECHPGRDKRLPPTWNVLSEREAGSLRETDEKQGGCGSPTRGTLGGDKSGPDGGTTHAINGKSSAPRVSEVSPGGIQDRASLNYSPAATGKPAGVSHSQLTPPRTPASPTDDVRICHSSSWAEETPRDTTSGDVSQQAAARATRCPSKQTSPLGDKEVNSKKSPKKAARLTSIIDGLKKSKRDTGLGPMFPLVAKARSPKLQVDTSPKLPSSGLSPADRLDIPEGTTLSPYTGALSLALLSNPLYLQSVYPYGLPKEVAAMFSSPHFTKAGTEHLFHSSMFPSTKKRKVSKNKDRHRKRSSSNSRFRAMSSQPPASTGKASLSPNSSDHPTYDKDGALDLSIGKRSSTDKTGGSAKKPRADSTLHYYPSSPQQKDESPLQRLERLQHFPHH